MNRHVSEYVLCNQEFLLQKVDIYSLGVMFFEMCYRPLLTHMERIKVLADLRLEECVLPADFVDNAKQTKAKLLRYKYN